jgi:hypothetical protein
MNTFKPIFRIFLMISLGLFILCLYANGQNVGINTTGSVPNSSALLDVDASPGNNLGMLIPRVALTQTSLMAPIVGAAVSLLVYNTNAINDVTPGFYYWNGSAWVRFFTSNGGAWQLIGNAGTIASTSAIGVAVNNNFIGTTDAVDFVIASNNLERMRISSAGNIGIGTIAPVAPFQIAGNNPSLMFSPTISGGGGSYRSFKIQSIPGAGFGYLAISCISDDNVNTYSGLTIGAQGDLGVGYPWLNPIPYNLSFYVNAGGQVTKTIGVTTNLGGAGFPGGHLSISAGAPGNGADQTGGNLYLSSGNSRGNQGSQMEFRTTTPGAAGLGINTATTKMIILATGNVGIGTLAPLQKLDVNGNINMALTMNLRINDVRVLSNLGSYNLFVGDNAGIANLAAGQYNSFFGWEAGSRNTTGMYNTFLGFRAGNANIGGHENVIIGDRAGANGAATLGDFNVLVGAHSGISSTGIQNTFIGGQAGYSATTGGSNVFVGGLAGDANTTGSYNTIIGNNADVGSTGLTKSGAIGYNAIVNASNAFVIGGTGVDAVNVGIGIAAPTQSLHVVGNILFTGAIMPGGNAGTVGKVLTSAGAGVTPTWSVFDFGNPGATTIIGKYYAAFTWMGTWSNGTYMTQVVTDPNCRTQSCITVAFDGPWQVYHPGIFILNVVCEAGQFRVTALNNSGFNISGSPAVIPISFIAFY